MHETCALIVTTRSGVRLGLTVLCLAQNLANDVRSNPGLSSHFDLSLVCALQDCVDYVETFTLPHYRFLETASVM